MDKYLACYPYTVLNDVALNSMLSNGYITNASLDSIEGHYIDLSLCTDIKLKPKENVLVYTEEFFNMPDFLTGWITVRSTYARMFVDQINSIPIKAGWTGNLLLELVNHGNTTIDIAKGQAVVQAWFMKTPATGKYVGKFNNQNKE